MMETSDAKSEEMSVESSTVLTSTPTPLVPGDVVVRSSSSSSSTGSRSRSKSATSSVYRGVFFESSRSLYTAQFYHKGGKKMIKRFASEKCAARWRDSKAREQTRRLGGKISISTVYNFPRPGERSVDTSEFRSNKEPRILNISAMSGAISNNDEVVVPPPPLQNSNSNEHSSSTLTNHHHNSTHQRARAYSMPLPAFLLSPRPTGATNTTTTTTTTTTTASSSSSSSNATSAEVGERRKSFSEIQEHQSASVNTPDLGRSRSGSAYNNLPSNLVSTLAKAFPSARSHQVKLSHPRKRRRRANTSFGELETAEDPDQVWTPLKELARNLAISVTNPIFHRSVLVVSSKVDASSSSSPNTLITKKSRGDLVNGDDISAAVKLSSLRS